MTSPEWVDRDFYADLGVSAQASQEDIKKAYRRLARQYHPDANPGDTDAEERFKRVSEAYTVLSDADKRAEYDQTRRLAANGAGTRAGASRSGGPTGFDPRGFGTSTAGSSTFDLSDLLGSGGAGMGMGDAQALFDSLFGGAGPTTGSRRGTSAPRRGADLHAELTLDFRTAVRGGTLPVQLADESGTRARHVRIPAGVTDSQTLRLRGQGRSPGPQGAAGDLYVRLHVTPDAVFDRRGNDLTLTLPVTLPELVFGAQVSVPTLDGTVTVRVPADSKPGQVLRVRGHGIPSDKPSDLLVTLQPTMPTQHNQAAREALHAYAEATRDFDPRAELQRAR